MITGSMASSTADLNTFGETRPMNHCATGDGGIGSPRGTKDPSRFADDGGLSASAASRSTWTRPKTGAATIALPAAAIVRSSSAMASARPAVRPSVRDSPIEPTLATSIDATSGSAVMRIRLMKTVPTGARTVATGVAYVDPPMASPIAKPTASPRSTRVVSDTLGESAEVGSDENFVPSSTADYRLPTTDYRLQTIPVPACHGPCSRSTAGRGSSSGDT